MSFATLLALRSRDTASAAKGPKVYDLFRPPSGGLAFRPRSPLGELTCALPNSLRRLSVRTFFRPFTRTHHHLRVRVLAAPLYCLLPLHTSASLHTSAQSTLVALCLVLLEVSLPFSAAGGSICPLVCLTMPSCSHKVLIVCSDSIVKKVRLLFFLQCIWRSPMRPLMHLLCAAVTTSLWPKHPALWM